MSNTKMGWRPAVGTCLQLRSGAGRESETRFGVVTDVDDDGFAVAAVPVRGGVPQWTTPAGSSVQAVYTHANKRLLWCAVFDKKTFIAEPYKAAK